MTDEQRLIYKLAEIEMRTACATTMRLRPPPLNPLAVMGQAAIGRAQTAPETSVSRAETCSEAAVARTLR